MRLRTGPRVQSIFLLGSYRLRWLLFLQIRFCADSKVQFVAQLNAQKSSCRLCLSPQGEIRWPRKELSLNVADKNLSFTSLLCFSGRSACLSENPGAIDLCGVVRERISKRPPARSVRQQRQGSRTRNVRGRSEARCIFWHSLRPLRLGVRCDACRA